MIIVIDVLKDAGKGGPDHRKNFGKNSFTNGRGMHNRHRQMITTLNNRKMELVVVHSLDHTNFR